MEMRLSQNCGDNIRIDRSAIWTSFIPPLHCYDWSNHVKPCFPPAEIEQALFLCAAIGACDYTCHMVQMLSHNKFAGFFAVAKHRVAATLGCPGTGSFPTSPLNVPQPNLFEMKQSW